MSFSGRKIIMYSSTLSWVLFLSSLLSSIAQAQFSCDTAADCNDKNPCTVDFCITETRVCANIPREISPKKKCSSGIAQVTRQSIIDFAEKSPLSQSDRLKIISIAKMMFRNVYPHLRFQRLFRRTDPNAKLDSLERDIKHRNKFKSNIAFHSRMIKVYNSLGDIHTAYFPPAPISSHFVLLPFSFRDYFDERKERKYVVTDTALGADFGDSGFERGVQLTSWDSVEIGKAVFQNGEESAGSNSDAKIHRGILRMTERFLLSQLLPKRSNVVVGFIDKRGRQRKVTISWVYAIDKQALPGAVKPSVPATVRHVSQSRPDQSLGDLTPHEFSSIRAEFNQADLSFGVRALGKVFKLPVNDSFKSSISGDIVWSSSGLFGRIRMFNFPGTDIPGFFDQFVKLLALMPPTGLVIDVRGHDGGSEVLSQVLVQTFTNRTVMGTDFRIRATPFFKKFFTEKSDAFLIPSQNRSSPALLESIDIAMKVGDRFAKIPTTTFDSLNSYKGAKYKGPVVVLNDAACYSGCDLFSLMSKDNGAATIVGIDSTTGAGGSSAAPYDVIFKSQSPSLPRLPGGVSFQLSISRFDRVRDRESMQAEYFGIQPDVRYYMTKRDRVEGDKDLFDFLGKFFASKAKGQA